MRFSFSMSGHIKNTLGTHKIPAGVNAILLFDEGASFALNAKARLVVLAHVVALVHAAPRVCDLHAGPEFLKSQNKKSLCILQKKTATF